MDLDLVTLRELPEAASFLAVGVGQFDELKALTPVDDDRFLLVPFVSSGMADYIGAAEPLQRVWIALRASERAILEEVTLGQIVSGELPDSVTDLVGDPRAWA